jgi:hypothetical protein
VKKRVESLLTIFTSEADAQAEVGTGGRHIPCETVQPGPHKVGVNSNCQAPAASVGVCAIQNPPILNNFKL